MHLAATFLLLIGIFYLSANYSDALIQNNFRQPQPQTRQPSSFSQSRSVHHQVRHPFNHFKPTDKSRCTAEAPNRRRSATPRMTVTAKGAHQFQPWVAKIMSVKSMSFFEYQHLCTGTVLSSVHVSTKVWCLFQLGYPDFEIVDDSAWAGHSIKVALPTRSSVQAGGALSFIVMPIKAVHIIPSPSSLDTLRPYAFDTPQVALIELSEPIDKNPDYRFNMRGVKFQPIPVAATPTTTKDDNLNCFVASFGADCDLCGEYPRLNYSSTASYKKANAFINSADWCAGDMTSLGLKYEPSRSMCYCMEANEYACATDYGSPIVCQHGPDLAVHGILVNSFCPELESGLFVGEKLLPVSEFLAKSKKIYPNGLFYK